MSLTKITLISIAIGFTLSFFGILVAFDIFNYISESSYFSQILFWNMFLARHLIEIGSLPGCENCEMMIVFYVLFYAFFIGFIGYFLASFFVVSLIDFRNKKSKVGSGTHNSNSSLTAL